MSAIARVILHLWNTAQKKKKIIEKSEISLQNIKLNIIFVTDRYE